MLNLILPVLFLLTLTVLYQVLMWHLLQRILKLQSKMILQVQNMQLYAIPEAAMHRQLLRL